MIRLKTSLDHKKIRYLIWLVLTLFVLLGYSLQSVAGTAYYSLVMQNYGTVSTPPVILQNGTAGTSTIYTNNTSAKVSVEAPLFDYVDNNDADVDSSADRGMHSNFPAEKAVPDSTYDTLKEENTEAIEDSVDVQSDVDSSADQGTHSDFDDMKVVDGIKDTLTEAGGAVAISKLGTDTSDTGTSVPLQFNHVQVSGTNRIIIVAVGFENNGNYGTVSATYGGDPMSLAVQGSTATTGYLFYTGLFYILDGDLGSDGTKQVSITASGTIANFEINAICMEYENVFQGPPQDYDNTDEASPPDDTIENTGLSFTNGAWVISAIGCGDVGSFTHAQGQVEVLDSPSGSSTFAVAELQGTSGESTLESTYSTGANRLERVCAGWNSTGITDYKLDLEVQFTDVIDFLPTEKLCIYTGTLGGEDLRADYWNGTGWENLATDLIAYSCNEYTVSLTSTNFTVRFKGGNETGDTTQDQWQIDASLLRVEGAGGKEDAVDQQSNIDGSQDVGAHSNFTAQQYGPDLINDTLTEANTAGYSNSTLLDDGFEAVDWDENWDAIAHSWQEDSSPVHSGLASAWATNGFEGYFTCDNLNASDAVAIYIDFWFRKDDTGFSDFTLYYYDGTGYDLIDELDNNGFDDIWLHYTETVTDNQYFISNFRIRFDATLGFGMNVWVDDVLITKEFQSSDNYELDLEVQWTGIPYLLPNENLSIYGGTMGAEDIKVDVWNGTGWETVFTDLSSGWNNASITDWLITSNFTIRFKGGTETGDTNEDTWEIDVALIHVWSDGGESYELDLEVQWTGADYTRTNEELCIRTGTFSGSEDIQVRVWNNTGSSWHWVMNLTASQWNNVSITSYLTSSTFTVQFLGGTETGDTTQDNWNIDATLLHVWTGTSTWLGGWGKRVKITIDHDDIDSDLSDFPVLVYLSNSSGRNNEDVSFVFNEVGSNSKKIAVTESDATTQCYVEIEKWDDAGEEAWLWVKVPSISNTSDTDLYLYYDNDHADNTDYVDDTNTGNSVNVWDSYFKMVQHMRDNTTSSIVDSTSNDNDGTKLGAGQPAVTTSGNMDGAQNFPSGDVPGGDYINCGNDLSLQITGYLTIGAWVKIAGSDEEYLGIAGKLDGVDQEGYALVRHSNNRFRFWVADGTMASADSDANYTDSDWHYVVGVVNNGNNYIYVDGVKQQDEDTTTLVDSGYWAHIGRQYYDYDQRYWEGIIDEVRISNVSRSAAWIKASYESGRDDLLDFGSEEGNIEDYVDNNTSNVDSSSPADRGTHSNFTAQQYGPDSIYDTLTEETEPTGASFYEDWESGSISSNWTTYSSVAAGRIVVEATNPYGGSTYALWMDSSTGGTYALNELITNYDFSGAETLELEFYHNEYGDENNAGSDHTGHQNADAVYFSPDNYTWYHLFDLVDPSGWTYQYINVSADPDFPATVNSSFVIKFTQYDNYPRTNDGRGLENINITYQTGEENYELDLEVQWTDASYLLPNGELCIRTGTTGTEDVKVDVWNETEWVNVLTNLTPNSWNNVSVSSYFTSSNFTIRFKGGNETGDTNQDSWNIDATLLHIWTSEDTGEGNYDHVLRVNNTGTDSWEVRLKKYSDSNVNRLQDCTICFHNSTDGTSSQIDIEDGSYINQTGPWYDLGDSETIYIAMTVQANSAATSYVYAYLEIRIPNTTTYAQYVVTFEIT